MSVLILGVCLAAAVLYAGQLISCIDFGLAQRLGLQEGGAHSDPLFSRLELNAAGWDLLSLWILPVAGILFLFDHPWWPYLGLVGGGVHLDTGGREAAKMLGLRAQGVHVGARNEQGLALAVFAYFIISGLFMVFVSLAELG